jgi:hypothetical protein
MAAAALSIAALGACGGQSGEASAPATPTAAPPAASAVATSRLAEVASAKVYDPSGNASTCAPPKQDCPPLPVERAFLDQCRLAGFRIVQCGCASRCTGNTAAASRRFDRDGNAKECAPARPDCTPPPASASFQDACTEKGHRLETCGCEWLCTGNPTK